MTIPEYEYSPLVNSQQIRLLHIYPASNQEPLIGEIEHVSFNQIPGYQALSYEWGNANDVSELLINDDGALKRLTITKSLHHALCDLRHREKSDGMRAVWADAACIDQSDLQERQQQVSIMGIIYRSALRVVTYVGAEEPDTHVAINFMEYLLSHPGATDRKGGVDKELPLPEDLRCTALKNLVCKGWAGRCWCAQEFILNKNLILMYGRYEIEWSLVPKVVQLVFNRILPSYLLPNSTEDPDSVRECLTLLLRTRNLVQEHNFQPTLSYLLWSTYPMQASDPRDKIYSLLGLASDAEELQIPIDYKQPVEQLYITVATRLVQLQKSIGLLYCNLGVKKLKLPSWVPDWSTWRFGTSGMLAGRGHCAASDQPAVMKIVNSTTLEVAGSLQEKIIYLSDPLGPHLVSKQAFKEIVESHPTTVHDADVESTLPLADWIDTMIELAAQLVPYCDGSTAVELVWRTLTSNMTLEEKPSTKAYEKHFEAFYVSCREEQLRTQRGDSRPSSLTPLQQAMAQEFRDNMRRRMRYRRLCITDTKLFAAVPEESKQGDYMAIIEGARTPFVLRGVSGERSGCWLIGPAYVHGLMNGEALRGKNYKRWMIPLV